MKNLFQSLFGRAAAKTATPEPARAPAPPAPADARRTLAQAATPEERAKAALELGKSLGRQGSAPAADDPQEVWIAAIGHAATQALALAWLDNIGDEAALERIALEARASETRLAAAKRLTDPARVERLAGAVRDKDRGVYRYCHELLQKRAEATRRAEAVDGLCERLRELLDAHPLPAAALYEIRKQAAHIEDGADLVPLRDLLHEATQREQADAARLKALDAQAAGAKALLKELAGADGPPAEPLDAWQTRIRALADELSAVPDWLAAQPARAELARLVADGEARLAALREDAERAEACRQFLTEVPPAVADADAEQLRTAWEALPKPRHAATREALMAEWRARSPRPAAVPADPTPKPKPKPRATAPAPDHTALRPLLDALEQALEEGQTQRAFGLSREIHDQLGGATPPRALAQRYRALQARLEQLRDWARWSGGNARDQLIEAAEALLAEPPELDHLAEAVPKLREDWKRLDGQGRASQAQWQRFDTALTAAYQPVLAERAEREAQRKAALEAKRAFLDETARWCGELVWEAANAPAIQRALTDLDQRWRALASAGKRDDPKLLGRYRHLREGIEAGLREFIGAETERRQRLIAAARRLELATDLRDAVNQAKELQRRWRDEAGGVQLGRSDHERLWQQFRAAIDAVFARRDAERNARETRQDEQLAGRRALLDAFEQELRGEPDQHRIETAWARFNAAWEAETDTEAGPEAKDGKREAPRRDPLGGKAAELARRAESLLRELRAGRQRELFRALAGKAALAERLETAALAGAVDEELSESARREWQAAPNLPADLERGLAARFQAAPAATAEILAEGLARRAALLLDLEILLELPTPPEQAEPRTRRQLEWLQRGFQDLKTPFAMLGMVGQIHATAAPAEPTHAERLARIVARLSERLAGDTGY